MRECERTFYVNNPYGVGKKLWEKLDAECKTWIKEYSERCIEIENETLEGHRHGPIRIPNPK